MSRNPDSLITDELYQSYLGFLLSGDRPSCTGVVETLLDRGIALKSLYADLFQKSLYEVGKLWESNRISVAREHLATAITEGLMSVVYPKLFEGSRDIGKAVISCSVNEYHQIGGKMVSDIFEMNGWQGYFLGSNTPQEELISFVDEVDPDLLGLSLSVYFNYPALERCIEAVRSEFVGLDILVGGQAFSWGGTDSLGKFSSVEYVSSLDELEKQIRKE